MSDKVSSRLVFIDNLRLFLIVLVILHHVSVAYGGSGGWPLKEPPGDEISPIILTLFNALNQSFFMSLFFLLSGYFVPGSFDRKGAKKFFSDRLIRLGVPLLVYTTFFRAALDYMLLKVTQGMAVSFTDVLIEDLINPYWVIGPLWFVEELLIFSGAYVLYRILIDRPFTPFKNRFPTNNTIAAAILLLAASTFSVRMFYPVGVEWHVFQIGHSIHYMSCFWFGVLAYRGRWLDNLTEKQARQWKKIAVSAVIALPIIMALGILTGGMDVTPFLGGLTWQSALYSVWESIAALSIIITLVYTFRNRFDRQRPLLRWAAPNFYAAYILHQPVIVAIMIPLLGIEVPTYVKFVLVSLLGVLLCFMLSDLIRKIPYTRRVLG